MNYFFIKYDFKINKKIKSLYRILIVHILKMNIFANFIFLPLYRF